MSSHGGQEAQGGRSQLHTTVTATETGDLGESSEKLSESSLCGHVGYLLQGGDSDSSMKPFSCEKNGASDATRLWTVPALLPSAPAVYPLHNGLNQPTPRLSGFIEKPFVIFDE